MKVGSKTFDFLVIRMTENSKNWAPRSGNVGGIIKLCKTKVGGRGGARRYHIN